MHLKALVAAMAVAAFSSAAHAALSNFTTLGEWQTAATNAGLSQASDSTIANLAQANGFTTSFNLFVGSQAAATLTGPGQSSGDHTLFFGPSSGIVSVSGSDNGDGLRLSFANPVRGFFARGGNVTPSFAYDNGQVGIFVDNAAGDTSAIPPASTANPSFFGFISGTPFRTIDLVTTSPGTIGSTIAGLTGTFYAAYGGTVVPIPAALPLFMSGLGALAVGARLRRSA